MYNCAEYTAPVWKGNTVLYESFLPVVSREIPLLYPADEILEVRTMDQKRVFAPGKDYLLRDGCLYIPEGSAISVMDWETYNPQEKSEAKKTDKGFVCRDGGYLLFSEGPFFHELEYCVSYRHSGEWGDAVLPAADPEKLPLTKARLREGKPFTFGFFGDSIATGANSSSLIGCEPFAPIWPEMICERLRQVCGSSIRYVNRSVGGTTSGWGVTEVRQAFAEEVPDLMLIAFGMNDASGRVDRYVFRDNIRAIAKTVREMNPDCELLLVSTSLPNPLSPQFYSDHATHELLLGKLCGEFGPFADLVPITSMHRRLLARKRFYDMTGNNINHPNDFLARVYAQTALAVLGVE